MRNRFSMVKSLDSGTNRDNISLKVAIILHHHYYVTASFAWSNSIVKKLHRGSKGRSYLCICDCVDIHLSIELQKISIHEPNDSD